MKNTVKRVICICLAICFVVGMTGCGEKRLSELRSVELWHIQEELFDCIGMSKEEIEVRYPAYEVTDETDDLYGWQEDEDWWLSETSVAGIYGCYEFMFEDGCVTAAGLGMQYHNRKPSLLLEDYYYIHDLLLYEYGDPWDIDVGDEYKRGEWEMKLMDDWELWSEETGSIHRYDIWLGVENRWNQDEGEGNHILYFWVSAW